MYILYSIFGVVRGNAFSITQKQINFSKFIYIYIYIYIYAFCLNDFVLFHKFSEGLFQKIIPKDLVNAPDLYLDKASLILFERLQQGLLMQSCTQFMYIHFCHMPSFVSIFVSVCHFIHFTKILPEQSLCNTKLYIKRVIVKSNSNQKTNVLKTMT